MRTANYIAAADYNKKNKLLDKIQVVHGPLSNHSIRVFLSVLTSQLLDIGLFLLLYDTFGVDVSSFNISL